MRSSRSIILNSSVNFYIFEQYPSIILNVDDHLVMQSRLSPKKSLSIIFLNLSDIAGDFFIIFIALRTLLITELTSIFYYSVSCSTELS